jgi:hypothetical protein
MATIKLQNGKVITKDGKVSCECCEKECFSAYYTGLNVFEITKQEFNSYVRGGNWNVEARFNSNTTYNLRPDCVLTQIITANGETSDFQKGCIHRVDGVGILNATISGAEECSPTRNISMDFGFGIEVQIAQAILNGEIKYIAQYMGSTVYGGTGEPPGTGYPTTVAVTIDGNNLITRGTWNPNNNYVNFENNSNLTITANFT